MKVSVQFFSLLKDRAGARQAEFDLPAGARVADLRRRLGERFPGLGPSLQNMRIAIDRDFAQEDAIIPDGAEIAVFPPVSGG